MRPAAACLVHPLGVAAPVASLQQRVGFVTHVGGEHLGWPNAGTLRSQRVGRRRAASHAPCQQAHHTDYLLLLLLLLLLMPAAGPLGQSSRPRSAGLLRLRVRVRVRVRGARARARARAKP